MTSIVADVLQCTGKLAKENLTLKVDELKIKLEGVKLEVQESLKNRYIDFYPQYVKLDNFIDRLKAVTNEYEVIQDQIEKEIKPHVMKSVVEFHDVLDDLSKMKKLKSIVSNLVLLHEHLQGARSLKTQSLYLEAAHYLLDCEDVLQSLKSELQADVAIEQAMRIEFYVIKEDIIYHLQNAWNEKITINSCVEAKNKKTVTIACNKTLKDSDDIEALQLLNNFRPVLKEFGQQFLKVVCETLILNNVRVNVDENSSILTLTIINEHSPEPTEVFEELTQVFSFLHDQLFYLPLGDSEEGKKITLVTNEFGIVIGKEFCTLIVDKCLNVAIPKQTKQLEAFRKEILAAENFCYFLQDIGFFTDTDNIIMNFIQNVDVLPVNKMAQDFLSRARFLMKKNLHQTVTVGVKSAPVTETESSSDLNDMARAKNGLSKSTFVFPQCQISISVKEIDKLLQEVKDEAKNIGPVYAPRLYYVARSICELYCCVVPTFHKDEIANIPQQTAIFHNNCMYLAHILCTLGIHYEAELQVQISMTFVDLVPEIRKLGTDAFLLQMRHQKQQLLQLLQEQAYQNVLMDDDVINKAEKSIRQCLCQLQLLKKVWSDVLPIEVYFKALGTLFNTCLEEIILRILAMEDIAADAAAQMDSIFSILLKQGPDLFKVSSIDKSNFVHSFVRRWFKFQELQLLLGASMKEIVDRWSSGKGPLATHFTAEEVKHLIRALFQNTERRAAALAKIR